MWSLWAEKFERERHPERKIIRWKSSERWKAIVSRKILICPANSTVDPRSILGDTNFFWTSSRQSFRASYWKSWSTLKGLLLEPDTARIFMRDGATTFVLEKLAWKYYVAVNLSVYLNSKRLLVCQLRLWLLVLCFEKVSCSPAAGIRYFFAIYGVLEIPDIFSGFGHNRKSSYQNSHSLWGHTRFCSFVTCYFLMSTVLAHKGS